MTEETVRVFVAIELSSSIKTEIGRVITNVDDLGLAGVRTVRPQGVHLTLKFLGDIATSALDSVVLAMGTAAASVPPFGLSLAGTGIFPNPRFARVLWVGIDGDLNGLRQLQTHIEDGLASLGYRRDRRGFNPHVTIARIRDSVSAADRRRVIDSASSVNVDRLSIEVDSVSLIKSTLHSDGAIYEGLASTPLTEDL